MRGKPRPVRRRFTLIEILAAMAVLVVIMAALFQFLLSAQRAWTMTETNSRAYENAQIVFEIITKDLQSVMFSTTDNKEIPFYVGEATAKDDETKTHLSFVAAIEPATGAATRLCEVHYKCRTLTGSADYTYWFRRACVSDTEADWDFYGDTSTDTATNWVSTDGSAQKVVYGVKNLQLKCYDNSGVMAADSYATSTPAGVEITVTFFDEKLKDAPAKVRDATNRTFTKLIFLGARD